jgi:hypothetical protein
MRKLVIALCLGAAPIIYVSGQASAAELTSTYKARGTQVVELPPQGPTRYYSDYGWFWGSWSYGPYGGYGPFADCNGSRCYVGPPLEGRRHFGQYYYGPTGGYYRGWE